jgi:hypothetical protein
MTTATARTACYSVNFFFAATATACRSYGAKY